MKADSGYYCQRIMDTSFEKKCETVKKFFLSLASPEEKYRALIEMGSKLPPFPPHLKTEERRVQGCQSLLYLHSVAEQDKILFFATSDAMISAGLAALLISVYSGEPAKVILTSPPTFLTELGIQASLSMNRSNGLANIHLRMKQEALKYLLLQTNS